MLPMFPHEDADRAQTVMNKLKPLALAYWEKNDPARFKNDPFSVMVVALLSPRTKTEASRGAMDALFEQAPTPTDLAQLSYETVVEVLTAYDVQFPESKARHLLATAKQIAENDGVVPKSLDELMQYPGMGWKTSLLTLHLAYDLAPEICVDVHVARISQRMGFVSPKIDKPQAVSRALMDFVPHDEWRWVNSTFVYFGKTRCFPSKPNCKGCPVYDLCERVGVD